MPKEKKQRWVRVIQKLYVVFLCPIKTTVQPPGQDSRVVTTTNAVLRAYPRDEKGVEKEKRETKGKKILFMSHELHLANDFKIKYNRQLKKGRNAARRQVASLGKLRAAPAFNAYLGTLKQAATQRLEEAERGEIVEVK